jgi:hypothetical protein
MRITSQLPINTIVNSLSNQINSVTQSIQLTSDVVSIDTKLLSKLVSDKTSSVRFLRWVEPYEIGGVRYSLFFTEVDHNFKVGDRVFVEGGVYDSDAFISQKKYRKGSDGYKVLYVDRCKIVLDIEYTGQLPTNEEEIDNFVKVYVATTQEEFDYYCQTLSLRDDFGIAQNKFDLGFNNFLYLDGTFSITPGSYQLTSFADDLALSSTSAALGNSFVVRGFTNSSNYFINITGDLFNNNIIPYLNPGFTQSLSGFFNNGKLRMMSGNFTKNGVAFKNEYIYFYDNTTGTWQVDKSYLPTILTEQHFRNGVFKKGEVNQGLIGQHEGRLEYYGDNIKWNLGTTLNLDWFSGVMDSTIFRTNSSFAIFDRNNLPQIRANASNNGGAGYNYVFNTNFIGGDVINGNIFNMAVVYGTNSVVTSTLEDYLLGSTTTFSINLSGGVYYNSDILFASVSNSTLISSYVNNSIIRNSKAVNSEIESSVFLNSTWISDKILKIQEYEESNIVWYDENSNPVNYKMYKFYLTPTNWLRLREFQNFYFQDLVINIPSEELLNFFDDKFSAGQYYQTYDIVGSKPRRRALVQFSTARENRNSPGTITGNTNNLSPNDISLPSVDLFIEGGDDFVYGASSSFPRPFIGDTIDITNAYILDSDFVSGLFKDSRWISGNHFHYNKDYSFESYGGYTASINSSNKELILTIGDKERYDILGGSVSNIAFLNGVYYDSTLNGGNNLVPLPDTYRILGITNSLTGRDITLQDISSVSPITSIGTFSNSKFLITKNANNRWNYVYSTKFENSIISSGIFRRAYFKNCRFENLQFNSLDKDFSDVRNIRNLILSDIILGNNGNTINNGLVQFSHFISGNNTWNGGIFHRGVWNTSKFTTSQSPNSSVTISSGDNTFLGGIFRNSTWVDGQFSNGLFYKNATNIAGTPSLFLNSADFYYYDNIIDNKLRWSWQKGQFKNGDFEKSNFESGIFEDGNFYDSNFLKGEATGGNFGKTNIPFRKTRVWSGTFSNLNVINAEFRAEDPESQTIRSSIYWNSGVFNSGLFGVRINNYTNPSTYTYSATWVDGTFNNGQFTDIAEWKNGQFNNGKFTSYYWYEPLNPRTPFELSSFTGSSFSWQNGKFNDGEFGNGTTGSNSTWFKGEFNGGEFRGRYWRDGILTRGDFIGSATFSTKVSEVNRFVTSFNRNYFGFWQGGFVSKNKDKFIKDEKIWSTLERTSTSRRKNSETNFRNMLWFSGTFSNFDGSMLNSVWLDGTFKDGYFSDSSFNPYLNLVKDRITYPLTSNTTIPNILEPGKTYTFFVEIGNSTTGISSPVLIASGTPGFTSSTFVANGTNLSVVLTGTPPRSVLNIEVYPGTQSGFRVTDSCIWDNGEAFSSDFNFSKWNQGIFDSYATSSQGNAFGIIWKDGIVKYMNAYNILWENGIWKNGNWNGTPFYLTSTWSNVSVYPGYSEDIMNNIYQYSEDKKSQTGLSIWTESNTYHIINAFTSSIGSEVLSDPRLNRNFESYTFSGSSWSTQSFYWTFDGALQFFQDNCVKATFSGATLSILRDNSTDVFTELKEYEITIDWVLWNFDTSSFSTNNSRIRFDLGYTGNSSTTDIDSNGGKRINIFGPFTPNTFTWVLGPNTYYILSRKEQLKIRYRPIDLSNPDSKKLKIYKQNPSTQNWELLITNVSVREVDYEYDPINNTLLQFNNPPALKNQILLPTGIDYYFQSELPILQANFGNGRFLSGIWENGVWNNGWRRDLTAIWADNLSGFISFTAKNNAYQENKNQWLFTLNILEKNSINDYNGDLRDFIKGDRVSVGNLVTIDINGRRRLVRDALRIVNIDYVNNKMTLSLLINFPIRSIERDSENHLMYIVKNVWLNGIFLNGKFQDGVWNNGFVRGSLNITEFIDTQWIDGVFQGGLFRGFTSSYTSSPEQIFNTALIQKFTFYDENISGEPFNFKYNSWIDVNYYKTEGVNINKVNDKYALTPLQFTASYVDNNFYGFPTKDVLESVSYIRNGFDLNSRSYKLGWKWKEYIDWIPYDKRFGQFNEINQLSYINSGTAGSLSFITDLSNPEGFGIDNLMSDGWTFSFGAFEDGYAQKFVDINLLNLVIEDDGGTPGSQSTVQIPGGILELESDVYFDGSLTLGQIPFKNSRSSTGMLLPPVFQPALIPLYFDTEISDNNNDHRIDGYWFNYENQLFNIWTVYGVTHSLHSVYTAPVTGSYQLEASLSVDYQGLGTPFNTIIDSELIVLKLTGTKNNATTQIVGRVANTPTNLGQKPVGDFSIQLDYQIPVIQLTAGDEIMFILSERAINGVYTSVSLVKFPVLSVNRYDFNSNNFLGNGKSTLKITQPLGTQTITTPPTPSSPTGYIILYVQSSPFTPGDLIEINYTPNNPSITAFNSPIEVYDVGPGFIKILIDDGTGNPYSITTFQSEYNAWVSLNGSFTASIIYNVDPGGTEILTNYGNLSTNRERSLVFKSGNPNAATGIVGDKANYSVDIIDNIEIRPLERLRYSIVEIDVEHYNFVDPASGKEVNPIVFYNNYPSTYSIASRTTIFGDGLITVPLNQVWKPKLEKQREYFFNKRSLDMVLLGGSGVTQSSNYELGFQKIRFIETDMIPFLQIADDCIQFATITTWDSTPVVENPAGAYIGPPEDPGFNGLDPNNPNPPILPTDSFGNTYYPDVRSGFPGIWGQALPVGQTSIYGLPGNLTVIEGRGEPTWGSFYLVDAGVGCVSYLNEGVNVPFKAKAPDILGDIEFNYLQSVNIQLIGTEVDDVLSDIFNDPVVQQSASVPIFIATQNNLGGGGDTG